MPLKISVGHLAPDGLDNMDIKYLSSDLDAGVYENVIQLTHKKLTKTYTIYGFSQDECDENTENFIKEWFSNLK